MPTVQCSACNGTYALDHDNAVVHTFWYQPWLAWVASQCRHCRTHERWFMGPEYWAALSEALTDSEVKFVIEDFAGAEIYQDYIGKYPQIASAALTPRQSAQVDNFGQVLVNIPVDLLWDELTHSCSGE